MYNKFLPILLALLIFILATMPNYGSAGNPTPQATIKELTVTTSETHLLVFGTLENSFSSEMIELLHSGIPVKFSFFVEVFKTADNRPAELVTNLVFQHILNFDTLKEIYRLTLEEDKNKILSFKSISEAQQAINEINGAKALELKQLIPDNRYKLKIRAELYQKTLPLGLHNIIPFLSWWDVNTDWHSIEFKY